MAKKTKAAAVAAPKAKRQTRARVSAEAVPVSIANAPAAGGLTSAAPAPVVETSFDEGSGLELPRTMHKEGKEPLRVNTPDELRKARAAGYLVHPDFATHPGSK